MIADLLARLIAFPTVSSASNLDCLGWIEAELAGPNTTFRRFPNEDGTKANLLVTIGPEAPGGLLLSGHTDIVPTEGQAWTGDPFAMRRADGRLVGRGATDMKGFLAVMMALAQSLDPGRLTRPLHLAFSYDEEVGCTGVGCMAEWVGASGLAPRLAVIGEASSMRLIDGHKGGLIGWGVVTGKPGHSSQPDRYVNAVMAAAEVISFISRIRAEMRETGPRADGFDPPYSTIQVNTIKGGLHGNIVAESCRFFWEMRVVPGADDWAVFERFRDFAAREVEPAMKAVDPGTGIAFEILSRIPALKPEPAANLAPLARLLDSPVPRKVAYGTEAGIFQKAGVPSVVCGPGDVAQAHQPDEFIAEADLQDCFRVMERLVGNELM
ncbi:acetylornithine deacetylase [Prosthecomicrobium sp. N25]|uniref:acetylornithine deacetylase n=1 Tax=Prosthecomicrobium sp. N25 TaxID=3129254 RepID=UPI0030783A4E